MIDLKVLEERIGKLEERVKDLEENDQWMNQLYEKAKELSLKYGKMSAVFLQKKLLIDYPRASELIDRLRRS